jgi:hypothetical protein
LHPRASIIRWHNPTPHHLISSSGCSRIPTLASSETAFALNISSSLHLNLIIRPFAHRRN